jgi:hypothetical protein
MLSESCLASSCACHLVGITQPNANKWLHILLIVLHQTLRDLGATLARHLLALRERLARCNPKMLLSPFITMAPNDRSVVRTTMLSRKRTRAARKSVKR